MQQAGLWQLSLPDEDRIDEGVGGGVGAVGALPLPQDLVVVAGVQGHSQAEERDVTTC